MIIYKITNIVNKKIYIGLTVKKSAQSRFSKHVSEAKCSNENRYFLNAILKYGRENFKVEEIKHWISKGAQLSDTVHNLLISLKVITGKKINKLPLKKAIVKAPVEGEAAPAAAAPAPTPAA